MKLVFATNNSHKLDEIRKIAGDCFEILSLNDINCHADIPETENTFDANAFIKAKYVKENFGYDCFADDTGLEVEALNGAPGVYSARYAGEDCNPQNNMHKLLEEMKGATNRKAAFKTVIALILDNETYYFEGKIDGRIIEEKRGEHGFGYDPIFIPDGYDETFAELGEETKNTISHRALATQQLLKFLENHKS